MRLATQINILKVVKCSLSGSIPLFDAYSIALNEREEFNIGTNISSKKLKEHVNILICELKQNVPLLSIVDSPCKTRIGSHNLTDLNTSLLVYEPYNDIFNKINGYAANMKNAGQDEVVVRLLQDSGSKDTEDTVLEFFERVVKYMRSEGDGFKNMASPSAPHCSHICIHMYCRHLNLYYFKTLNLLKKFENKPN